MLAPDDSRVLAWGSNVYGALGLRCKGKDQLPEPAAVVDLSGRPVRALACAHFHSAAVADREPGQLYTWGRGALGVLGQGDEDDILTPRPVASLRGVAIAAVSCGPYQTAAVTSAGELWCWGWRLDASAVEGVCEESYASVPRRELALAAVHIRRVSCGHYCVAVVSADGHLYTWGSGSNGQLGLGDARDVASPTRVRGIIDTVRVRHVSCGKGFMLVLSEAAELFSHGDGGGGCLGCGVHESGSQFSATPGRIDSLGGVCGIACGDAHCAAVTDSGGVYTWGSSRFGRLGISRVEVESSGSVNWASGGVNHVWIPRRVEDMMGVKCVSVACGAAHTLVVTDQGAVWSWGGKGLEPPPTPQRLPLGGVCTHLVSGGAHCLASVLPPGAVPFAHSESHRPFSSCAGEGDGDVADPSMMAAAGLLMRPLAAGTTADVVNEELSQLRALLATEESRRDVARHQLVGLQQRLHAAISAENAGASVGGAEVRFDQWAVSHAGSPTCDCR